MLNDLLIKSYVPSGTIRAYRIVKFHTADNEVVESGVGATDLGIGVIGQKAVAATDGRVDVVRAGIAPVEYGDTVTRGSKLMSDADGKAVPAAASAGDNVNVIGIAEVSGANGDIGAVLIAPSVFQG
jgi:hypothetical protein